MAGWKGGCDTRACQPCPEGAKCEGGDTDPQLDGWKHLRPKALQIGDADRPVRKATVVHSGRKHHFWCDMNAGKDSDNLPSTKAKGEVLTLCCASRMLGARFILR